MDHLGTTTGPAGGVLPDGKDDLLALAAALPETAGTAPAEARRPAVWRREQTPPHVALRMAGMLSSRAPRVRLLDAGAGTGMLSAAFVWRQLARRPMPRQLEIVACESDPALLDGLRRTLEACRNACLRRGVEFAATVQSVDFVAEASDLLRRDLFSKPIPPFDAALLHPPRRKLSAASADYRRLESVGAEAINLYAAFLGLAAALLRPRGELVALVPRGFCHGPLFAPFRRRLFETVALRRIHVFEPGAARSPAETALQDKIILHVRKGGAAPSRIPLSRSGPGAGASVSVRLLQASELLVPTGSGPLLLLPATKRQLRARGQLAQLAASLEELGLQLSTGRVLPGRVRERLCGPRAERACPLVAPRHFGGLHVAWPQAGSGDDEALRDVPETGGLLLPAGHYVLVRRFAAGSGRRVVACLYDPGCAPGRPVGFENHLHFFHAGGRGLDLPLAKGLWAFLQSSLLDQSLRPLDGRTPVNAAALRSLQYPTAEQLRAAGSRIGWVAPPQAELDALLAEACGLGAQPGRET